MTALGWWRGALAAATCAGAVVVAAAPARPDDTRLSLVAHSIVVAANADLTVDLRLPATATLPAVAVSVRPLERSRDVLRSAVADGSIPDNSVADSAVEGGNVADSAVANTSTEPGDSLLVRDVTVLDGDVVRLTVPTSTGDDPERLDFPVAGPYLLRVTAGDARFDSVVVAQAHPVAVAVTTVVDAPLTLQPDGTTAIDPAVRSMLERLVTVLEASEAPLTLAIRPELLAGLSRSVVPGDAEVLSRLAAAIDDDRIVAMPYVALDPSGAAAAGLGNVFTAQLRVGEEVLGAALGHFAQRVVWVSTDPLTPAGTALVRDLGAKVVLRLAGAGIPPPRRADEQVAADVDPARPVTQIPVIVPDPAGELLARDTADPVLSAHRLAAELVALRQDDRGAVLVVDLGATDPATLDALLAIVRRGHDLVATAVDETVRAGTPTSALVETSGTIVNDLTAAAAQRDDLVRLVAATSELLVEGDARAARWPELADALLDAHLSDGERDDYAAALRDTLTGIQQRIVVLTPSAVNLGDRRTAVPITVRNDNDFPVRVAVRLTGAKLRPSLPTAPVVIEAGATAQLRVPVEARTNGRFPVTAELVTAESGQRVGVPVTFSVRAGRLTGLGIVITFAAALALLTWWWQHLRRRTRRRRGSAALARHPVGSGSGR